MKTIESESINKWLENIALNGRGSPLFRLVWSDEQFEKRRGTFSEYYGEIFIREVKGVREVPKYPYFKSRWVLEKWYPPELVHHEDLVDIWQGSYEPLYVFEKANGEILPLNKRVIELIIKRVYGKVKSTPGEIKVAIENEIEEKQKEIDKSCEEIIGESTSSDIMSNLHFGEGIIVPASFHRESPNLRRKT